MYAICFDLNTEMAERHHPSNSETGAWKLIETVFRRHGFTRFQGSVYFGKEGTTWVQCALAVQELVTLHPWMRYAIRDCRALRVEENNDLLPLIGRQSGLFDATG
jgi:virulence-associated protein VapD